MRKTSLILALLAGLAMAPGVEAAGQATLYKNPQCTCCEGYAKYLRENGYDVKVVPTHDLTLINQQNGIVPAIEGCHTTLIDGYVIGGHVPVDLINKLLTERPAIKGISLPGMPAGSPGMFGEKQEPFTVYVIGPDPSQVYAVE